MLILKSLENEDMEICNFFYPDMFDTNTKPGIQLMLLKSEYERSRTKMKNDYDYYNLIEKLIIDIELNEVEKRWGVELDLENRIVKEIKGLAMCLSRFKPADWNKFLDVVIK